MKIRDSFAELYVAGLFADEGWNVFFPRRDQGFDFIISKPGPGGMQLLRPVQVKGKFPTGEKGDKEKYGFVGTLTQLHPDMVLAMPFFTANELAAPIHIAYLPIAVIRRDGPDHRCQPARFQDGRAEPRRDYKKFFDKLGITLIERIDWSMLTAERDLAELLENSP